MKFSFILSHRSSHWQCPLQHFAGISKVVVHLLGPAPWESGLGEGIELFYLKR